MTLLREIGAAPGVVIVTLRLQSAEITIRQRQVQFFLVERNSEEFSVILGILRNRSERFRGSRCLQELMKFSVKGWCKHSVQPSLECRYSLRFHARRNSEH
jgi:hypothetical protein